jgi:hypothetical protein
MHFLELLRRGARHVLALCVAFVFLSMSSAAFAGINTGLVGDDVAAGKFPIGFSFRFYGRDVTEFYVTTNG